MDGNRRRTLLSNAAGLFPPCRPGARRFTPTPKPMSVLNEAAGMTTEHIAAVEKTCREMNTFLLVRPSTKETM